MSLPQINDSLKYNLTIPSTKKKIHYRPYLVKEEKVLMTAFESGDQQLVLRAIVDTIASCVVEKLDTNLLSTFDIEYLFTQLRAKSVGETATLGIKCSKCDAPNDYKINIESIKVKVPKVDMLVELTDDISVKMHYPTYGDIKELDLERAEIELGMDMVVKSIESVVQGDQKSIPENDEDTRTFLESMTATQFRKLSDFIEAMPALAHDAKFDCEHCGEKNSLKLRGIQDFLS